MDRTKALKKIADKASNSDYGITVKVESSYDRGQTTYLCGVNIVNTFVSEIFFTMPEAIQWAAALLCVDLSDCE